MPKIDKGDALITVGILSTVGGVGMIHVPSAAIIFGLILVTIGFIYSLPGKR